MSGLYLVHLKARMGVLFRPRVWDELGHVTFWNTLNPDVHQASSATQFCGTLLFGARMETSLPGLKSGTSVETLFGDKADGGKHCSVQALDMNVHPSLEVGKPFLVTCPSCPSAAVLESFCPCCLGLGPQAWRAGTLMAGAPALSTLAHTQSRCRVAEVLFALL